MARRHVTDLGYRWPRTSIQESLERWGKTVRDRATGCLLWEGAKTDGGHGLLLRKGPPRRKIMVHRAAWELARGPVPPKQYVRQTCARPNCIEVDHLYISCSPNGKRK